MVFSLNTLFKGQERYRTYHPVGLYDTNVFLVVVDLRWFDIYMDDSDPKKRECVQCGFPLQVWLESIALYRGKHSSFKPLVMIMGNIRGKEIASEEKKQEYRDILIQTVKVRTFFFKKNNNNNNIFWIGRHTALGFPVQ